MTWPAWPARRLDQRWVDAGPRAGKVGGEGTRIVDGSAASS